MVNNENDNVAAQVNFVDHGPLVVDSYQILLRTASINKCVWVLLHYVHKSDTTEPVENNKERPDLS